MVSYPPLSPSIRWWAHLLKYQAFLNGKVSSLQTIEKAIEEANAKLKTPKEFGRFILSDTKGEPVTLSLALEGGGRQLRTIDRNHDLKLSEHGDWRKVHLGAIETCLGRKPFFRHLEIRIKDVYSNTSLDNLKEFNSAIFQILYSFLMENISPEDLSGFKNNPVLLERGKEIARNWKTEISALQAVADFGKESLLGILAIDI